MGWDHDRLDALRGLADPHADVIAAAYQQRYPEDDPRELVRRVRDDIADPDRGPGLLDSLPMPQPGPALSDPDRLRRGQEVFREYGLEMCAALYFAGLPISYCVLGGAEVLSRTSDLATSDLSRRVAETGQMMVDVFGLESDEPLSPGTKGYSTCQGVRLMHSMVRALIRASDWDEERFGEPVNQEMMLGTLLAFTHLSWVALDRFGVALDTRDREAHAYVWSVVGALLGISESALPLTPADTAELVPLLFARHVEASDGGHRLAAAMVEEMQSAMPLGFRRVPVALIRWLFDQEVEGVDMSIVPDLLGLPPGPRWPRPLFALQRRLNLALRPWRRTPIGRWWFRRLTRLVVTWFIDRDLPGAPAFELPSELSRQWRIRTGPTRTGIRRARSRTRQGARRLGTAMADRLPRRNEG